MLDSLQNFILSSIPSPTFLIGVSAGLAASYIFQKIYVNFSSSNLETEESSRNLDLNSHPSLGLDPENSNLDMVENHISSEPLLGFLNSLQIETANNLNPDSLLPPSDNSIVDQDGRLGSIIVDNALSSLHLNVDCIDNYIINTILGEDFEFVDFVVDRLFLGNSGNPIIGGASTLFFFWIIAPYVIRTNAGAMFSESLPTPGDPGIREEYEGVTDRHIDTFCATLGRTLTQDGSEETLQVGRAEGAELYYHTPIGGYISSFYESSVDNLREHLSQELAYNPDVRREFSNAIKSLNFYEKLDLYQTLKNSGGSRLREDQYKNLIKLVNDLPSLSEISRDLLNLDGSITDLPSLINSSLRDPFFSEFIVKGAGALGGEDEGFQFIVNRAFPSNIPLSSKFFNPANIPDNCRTLQRIPVLNRSMYSVIRLCLKHALEESGLPINTDLDMRASIDTIIVARDLALGYRENQPL